MADTVPQPDNSVLNAAKPSSPGQALSELESALMNATSWLETYRGMVYRWEVDPVDHFTVAFYFSRFEDATTALLDAIGLDPEILARAGEAAFTTECHVRYRRELRVGDILHVRS